MCLLQKVLIFNQRSQHWFQVIPRVIRKLSVVFKPYHGGEESGIMFDLTLKHSYAVPLNLFILWLSEDPCRLCGETKNKNNLLYSIIYLVFIHLAGHKYTCSINKFNLDFTHLSLAGGRDSLCCQDCLMLYKCTCRCSVAEQHWSLKYRSYECGTSHCSGCSDCL